MVSGLTREDLPQIPQIAAMRFVESQGFLALNLSPLFDLNPAPIPDDIHAATDLTPIHFSLAKENVAIVFGVKFA